MRKKNLPKYITKVINVSKLENPETIPVRISENSDPKLRKKGLILKVYGAYGAFVESGYDEFETMMMDSGYVVAQAHVRGSRAKGWGWYFDGKTLKKKNSIDDYLACASFLLENNEVPDSNLIAYGQSAGGLIIGAAINQKPHLFKAGIFDYPYLDVLSTMSNDTLPLTTLEYQEWGNPKVKEESEYIKIYSPYQNIEDKVYPDMIFFAGIRDFQTPYWQIFKSVARYRKSNLSGSDIIIHIGDNAHPGFISYGQRSKEMIYQYLFVEKTTEN